MKDAPLNTLLEFPAGIEARGCRLKFARFCRKMTAPRGSETGVVCHGSGRFQGMRPAFCGRRPFARRAVARSTGRMIDNV
jgi:hypothetical protein